MARIVPISFFIILFNQTVWADEMSDKGKYSAIIRDSLDKNGADCRVDTYSVKEKTGEAIIFSIKCTRSSYLKDIEVTCAQRLAEQCFVTKY
jgi:hypothetical protein